MIFLSSLKNGYLTIKLSLYPFPRISPFIDKTEQFLCFLRYWLMAIVSIFLPKSYTFTRKFDKIRNTLVNMMPVCFSNDCFNRL